MIPPSHRSREWPTDTTTPGARGEGEDDVGGKGRDDEALASRFDTGGNRRAGCAFCDQCGNATQSENSLTHLRAVLDWMNFSPPPSPRGVLLKVGGGEDGGEDAATNDEVADGEGNGHDTGDDGSTLTFPQYPPSAGSVDHDDCVMQMDLGSVGEVDDDSIGEALPPPPPPPQVYGLFLERIAQFDFFVQTSIYPKF